MRENSEDFSIREAKRLAASPAGQQLYALLRSTQADALQQAMDQAAAGNMAQAAASVEALLSSPEAKRLLEQLGG